MESTYLTYDLKTRKIQRNERRGHTIETDLHRKTALLRLREPDRHC